ncbi:MAG: histidine phosphatase family protein [Pseudomonadota bacterium]
MAVILMRHTRPVFGSDYCYGNLDIGLADTFDADAAAAIALLPTVEHIVSSPLQRARQLAQKIAEQRELPLAVDPRVSEMDFGAWEGLPWASVSRDELDAWAADFLDARPHGGESVRMVWQRCQDALAEYASRDGDTLVVCHAGVVRAAFAHGCTEEEFQTSIGYGETRRWPGDDNQTGDCE